MGQTNSSPSPPPAEPARRRNRNSLLSRSNSMRPQHLLEPDRQPLTRARPLSAMPLSRPFSEFRGERDPSTVVTPSDSSSRRSRLGRVRTAITSLPDRFRRPNASDRRASRLQTSLEYTASGFEEGDISGYLPDIDVPDLDLNFDPAPSQPADIPQRAPQQRDSPRPPSMFSDRISALRPDRGLRSVTNSLRRRRSPLRRGEDQAAMLSRLLSVAAAATAASLMGGNPRAASEARNTNGDGEDGTFDGFLQALQNGRIASALRQGSGNDSEEGAEGTNGASAAPLNFFRMFRFGSSNSTTATGRTDNMSHARNGSNGGQSTNGDGSNDGPDGRLVPIIIVGIRSITPGSGNGGDDGQMIPPFIDALSNFPTALSTGPNTSSIDGVLRPPQNGTRFSHRRRASMGGLNSYDNQRHHRSPERNRPWSTISEASSGPRPPPTTPASPGLSAVSSGTTTPTQSASASAASTAPHSRVPSRRESLINRPPPSAMNLTSTAEESSPSSPTSSNIARSSPRQRRLSESDFPTRFGSGSSRRNGVVEPLEAARPPSSPFSRSTNADPSSSTSAANSSANTATPGQNGSGNENRDGNAENGSRSWIIYVLGGSYPENHPILTTPSLFTENPTYEDMLLLSALLGPAKPPVASETDVESAGGLYTIEIRGAETMETEEVKERRAGEFEKQMQRSVEEEIRKEEEEAGLVEPTSERENIIKDADGDVHMVDVEQQSTAAAELGLDPKPVRTIGVPKVKDTSKAITLVAVADDGSDVISLNTEQRCLVCQYEFERKESVRRLVKCGHLFHRECIDKWLTTGRNSCPLCRGQGVDEKSTNPESGSEDSPTAAADMSPAELSSAVSGAQAEDILARTLTGEMDVDTEEVVG
ncbi:hypothetical protein EV356DRAFT_514136 [Viridothelium virens]|uniref:RING-type E3 ubiquitin transferase n=1 Tax=Viridothelium virens TaxID=1048519 RepID=A0A6A6HCM4_VIRVR|nr:hypothetical protein EV356DRAFT_514136 [Viridothelium virens]